MSKIIQGRKTLAGALSLRRGFKVYRCIHLGLVVGHGACCKPLLVVTATWTSSSLPSSSSSSSPTLPWDARILKLRAAAHEEPHPAVAGEGERPKTRPGGGGACGSSKDVRSLISQAAAFNVSLFRGASVPGGQSTLPSSMVLERPLSNVTGMAPSAPFSPSRLGWILGEAAFQCHGLVRLGRLSLVRLV